MHYGKNSLVCLSKLRSTIADQICYHLPGSYYVMIEFSNLKSRLFAFLPNMEPIRKKGRKTIFRMSSFVALHARLIVRIFSFNAVILFHSLPLISNETQAAGGGDIDCVVWKIAPRLLACMISTFPVGNSDIDQFPISTPGEMTTSANVGRSIDLRLLLCSSVRHASDWIEGAKHTSTFTLVSSFSIHGVAKKYTYSVFLSFPSCLR